MSRLRRLSEASPPLTPRALAMDGKALMALLGMSGEAGAAQMTRVCDGKSLGKGDPNRVYLLRAFLQFNPQFRVLFFNNLIFRKYFDEATAAFPGLEDAHASSIWIEKLG